MAKVNPKNGERFELSKTSKDERIIEDLISRVDMLEKKLQNRNSPPNQREDGTMLTYLADNVDIMGLRQAVTWKHLPLQVIWVLLISLGLAATVFYIYKNVDQYINDDGASKIRLHRDVGYEYPPLVICPPWPFALNTSNSAGLSIDGLKYSLGYSDLADTYLQLDQALNLAITAAIQDDSDNATIIHKLARRGREQFLKFYEKHNFSSAAEYFQAIGENATVTDTSGSEDTTAVVIDKCDGCDAEDKRFGTKVVYSNALCYLIPLQKAAANSTQYPTQLHFINWDRSGGALVPRKKNWIMDFSATTTPEGPSFPLQASSSFRVKLNAQNILMLKNDSACVDKKSPPNSNYDQQTCLQQCLDGKNVQTGLKRLQFANGTKPEDLINILDLYNTIVDATPGIIAEVMMNNISEDNMTAYIFNKMEESLNISIDLKSGRKKGASDADLRDCYESCLPACERMVYDVTISYSGVDENSVENASTLLLNVKHAATYQGGIIVLQEVDTMTFIDLVSNAGGTLGLFLGCAVMTLAQFILSAVNYQLNARQMKARACD